jgi:transposase
VQYLSKSCAVFFSSKVYNLTFQIILKTMPRNQQLTDFERGRIIGQWECGKKTRQIAEALGHSQSQVSRAIKAFRDKGQTSVEPRSGRPKIFTERNKRHLTQIVTKNRQITLDELTQEINEVLTESVSTRTVRRYLHEVGFHSLVGVRKPFVSEVNRTKRLAWCKARKTWDNEWKKIIWSDESRFTLFQDDSHKKVWRRPKEKYAVNCLVPTVKHGGGGIMVWGCFVHNKPGPLVVIEGRLNGVGYRELLADYLKPFLDELGPDLYDFQDDNAPIHTSRPVLHWKEENLISSIPWPAQSPDLNPIEHVWDHLERAVRQRRPHPRNMRELATVLEEEWVNLDRSYLEKLVESMPRRVQAVLESKGYPTRY